MLKNEIDDFESQGKQNEKTLCRVFLANLVCKGVLLFSF